MYRLQKRRGTPENFLNSCPTIPGLLAFDVFSAFPRVEDRQADPAAELGESMVIAQAIEEFIGLQMV